MKKYQAGLVAIIELFQKEEQINRFVQSLAFNRWCTNETRSGKICVIWDGNCDFDIVSISKQMITVWFCHDDFKCLITFVYAKCGFYDRRTFWLDLEGLNVGASPWLIVGDFNYILHDGECMGNQLRPRITLEEFNSSIIVDWLTSILLGDMTWTNG